MSEIYNANAERYLLKCMFNRPATIVEIVQSVNSNDFYNQAYRYLFDAIKNVSLIGDITSTGILNHLELKDNDAYMLFKNKGGAPTIERMLQDDTLPANPPVAEQINEVRSLSYRRKAVSIGNKIISMAENNMDVMAGKEFESIEELDENIKENVYSLAENMNHKEEIKTIGSSVDELIADIEQGGQLGIDIGYYYENGKKVKYMPRLNSMIKRLRDGALYIIGAPPKTGKSEFLLNIAWFIADKLGIPVGFGNTEMVDSEVLLRICSNISGVSEDKIAENLLNEDEKMRVMCAWEHIKNVKFYHFNTNDLTNTELESKVKLLQLKHGIRLFVYDYLKLQSHDVGTARPDLILAAKIDLLKEHLCKECNIPVLSSGQMWPRSDERGASNKFAESSHFEKLADVICRLDRVNESDTDLDLLGATHYIELVNGRKVRSDDIGKKIGFKVNHTNHRIEELEERR